MKTATASVVGLLLLCLIGWALLHHPVAASLVGLMLLTLWISSNREMKDRERRLVALAASRPGESICRFARSFDTRDVDPLIIRSVYQYLQEELHAYRPDFPLRASDNLKDDLELDDDDLDLSIAPKLADLTGRSLEVVESNSYFGRVRTVSDLVHFFNHQRELRPAN